MMRQHIRDNKFDRYRTHSIGWLAAAGTIIGAGTQIAGAVMGPSDVPGNEAAVAAALADYERQVDEWNQFWSDRIPRMTKNQRAMFKKTATMLDSYKGQFKKAFREGSLEKVHRKFVGEVNNLSKSMYTEIKGDIETLGKGELDPKFRQRVTEAEHEINRISADSLNDYVTRDARERAKGGMGFINPERRDELVAGNFARSRDMARGQARTQVEDTLNKLIVQKGAAGQNLIQNKQSLIDDYAGLGGAERARKMGRLQSNFGFDSQSLRNEASNRGYLDTLLAQRYQDMPVRSIPGIQPAQERSAGQAAVDIGGAVGDLLTNQDLNAQLRRWFGTGSGTGI